MSNSKTFFPINYTGIKDTLNFNIFKNIIFSTGIYARLYYFYLNYKNNTTDPYSDFFSSYLYYSLTGNDFLNNNDSLVNDTYYYDIGYFFNTRIKINKFLINPSAKINYLSSTNSIYPHFNISLVYYFNKLNNLVFYACRIYDKIDYISRFLFSASKQNQEENLSENEDENYINDDFQITKDYIQTNPATLYTINIGYESNNNINFSITAYFNYLTDMSGFNFQTFLMYSNYGNIYSQYHISDEDFKPSDKMYSTGLEVNLKKIFKTGKIVINYAFGYSQYHLEKENRWIYPNTDIRHTLKCYYIFTLFKHLFIDFNLNIYEGITQTPNMVIEKDSSPFYEIIPDIQKYNELRDWMPRFNINFLLKYRWKNKKSNDVSIFLDIINLICFPRYIGPKILEPGFEEKSFLDRNYDWSLINKNISDIKINFGFEMYF